MSRTFQFGDLSQLVQQKLIKQLQFHSSPSMDQYHNAAMNLYSRSLFLVSSISVLQGFMFGRNVLDKDGVSAAVVAAEMRMDLGLHGLTFATKLKQLQRM